MADRFPLIVNSVSKKIEELVSGDNLDLTGNGIIVGGDTGAGKYLKSDGSTVSWDTPGDVFLDATQILTNKTLNLCTISGSNNSITNLPNTALVNSGITINGTTVSLGGSISVSNTDTTYSISVVNSVVNTEKIIRLSDSNNNNDDIKIAVGPPASVPSGSNALDLFVDKVDDTITVSGYVTDNNTVTTLESGTGGSPVSGQVILAAGNFNTISQTGQTITITGQDTDTITRLRATTGQTAVSGDFTFLATGAASVSQGLDGNSDPTITIDATNTVTRVKGGGSGSFQSGDITVTGGSSLGGNVTVSQTGNTIEIDSTDTNTVTQVAANSESLASGDFRLIQAGATTISSALNNGVREITISSVNTDTGASLTADGGIVKTAENFSLKNNANFVGNTVIKWDSGNSQLANSIIQDDGSTVTIGGDLIVDGTQTILNTSTLVVEDNIIEMRKGASLTAADGGIQVNLTTNANEDVVTYRQLQWYNAGGYWRSWDGSVEQRFVTENETQILTNKTLTSPTLNSPSLGNATATAINGLTITGTASATLDVASGKTLDVNRDLVLTSDNNSGSITVNFRNGGNVAMTSDTLATFASTTSTQMRGVVPDSTGTGALVFGTNPTIVTGLQTTTTGLTLFNSVATAVTMFGAADQLTIGNAGGITDLNQNLHVYEDLEIGVNNSGTITNGDVTVWGQLDLKAKDLLIRGDETDPMKVGRGSGEINTNTAVGVRAINSASSGSQNTALGYEALFTANTGASNTAVGLRALRACGVGASNIAIGRDALLTLLSGDKNIAIGNNALEGNSTGGHNVCIGHYAGYGATGSGNVLIGPADDENSTNATFVPPVSTGSRQLVIGSGTESWIRGDSDFKVTVPNDFAVIGAVEIGGSLTVNGTLTTINSNVVAVDDKEIELASVEAVTFDAVTISGSDTITAITPTRGLIPGMEVAISTANISVPPGTIISSINGNTAVLSNSVTGEGTAVFTSQGASDLSADQGGIRVKGSTDKRIYYDHSRTDKYWVMSENLEIPFGKKYVIGNQLALSADTLGSTVVNSSLTSVGTLTSLDVDGSVTIGGVVTEKVFNSYSTVLTPSSNILTINVAGANTICGTPAASQIDEWAFTGVGLSNGQSKTITLILAANTAAIYGDDCSVDGTPITNGVQWSGGSPPVATSNTDILTFIIVTDNSGVTKVFGQGNTDFS